MKASFMESSRPEKNQGTRLLSGKRESIGARPECPLIFLAAALVVTAGCSQREVRLAAGPPPPRTATDYNMQRQIANAVDAGDGDLEARALRRQLTANPDNLDVRMRLAAKYEGMGFPEVAIEHYRFAAARFPLRQEVHVRLARGLRAQGLREEAVTVLEQFNARGPRDAEVLAWIGILRDEMGQLTSGERAHRAAIEVAGASAKAYLFNNLGQNLLSQGRAAEAAGQFQRALELEPRSAVARNNLGRALSGEPEQALANWRSVGDASTAHTNLAAVLIEQGRYPEARVQLNTALGYKPDNPAALRNLALVAELDGQPAVVDPHAPVSVWRRVGGALHKVFLSPDESKDESVTK